MLKQIFEMFLKKTESQNGDFQPGIGKEFIVSYLSELYPNAKPKCATRKGIEWFHDKSGKTPPIECWYVFDAGNSWHYFSIGLTDLYEKSDLDSEYSGWGYELSIRLEKIGVDPPMWPISAIDTIAQFINDGATFGQGVSFHLPYKDNEYETGGYLALLDPQIPSIDGGPFGKMSIILLAGLTTDKLNDLKSGGSIKYIDKIRKDSSLWMIRAS